MSLQIVPLTFRQACAFVGEHHRHNGPPRGMRFCIGVATPIGELVGVAIVSRPIARGFDDGRTLECSRSCTDGTPNVNSALYGAVTRAAFALGYLRVVTYTHSVRCTPPVPIGSRSDRSFTLDSAQEPRAGRRRRDPPSG